MTATAASAEDLDHVRETTRLLCLAVCQIETTLNDSRASIARLGDAFTHLAETRSSPQIGAHSDGSSTAGDPPLQTAVTALQHYDRISQRLDHVAKGLAHMTTVLNDPEQLHDPKAWDRIKDEVKNSYSMECERLMFEQIMRGASIEEALQTYHHHFEEPPGRDPVTGDDIELF